MCVKSSISEVQNWPILFEVRSWHLFFIFMLAKYLEDNLFCAINLILSDGVFGMHIASLLTILWKKVLNVEFCIVSKSLFHKIDLYFFRILLISIMWDGFKFKVFNMLCNCWYHLYLGFFIWDLSRHFSGSIKFNYTAILGILALSIDYLYK